MLNKLKVIAEEAGLNVLILSAPDNVEYFTEVPTLADGVALLVYEKKEDSISLYVPLLEYYRYRDHLPQTVNVYAVSKTTKLVDAPVVELDWGEIAGKYREKEKIGFDASHPSPLQKTIYSVIGEKSVDISNHVWRTRMIKSSKEIESIREAVKVTARGILAVYAGLRDGVTETSLTGLFEKTVRENGVERLAFDPIIVFKPNNAYPHALPSNRVLRSRDLVLLDVGVKVNGRCSDITRMITWGKPTKDEKNSIEAVVEALETAIDAIKPGVKAGDVHESAVKTLDKYGLRDRFIHGLGHGVGVVVHEPPYLRTGNNTTLEPGMVVTVEPGVYFPGKYGVRVEELVVVTKKGCRVLSKNLDKVLNAL